MVYLVYVEDKGYWYYVFHGFSLNECKDVIAIDDGIHGCKVRIIPFDANCPRTELHIWEYNVSDGGVCVEV